MNTLSLCMIVLNEEATLARILEKAKLFADEIIVTDTGSTDRTKEICLEYGCKLYSYVWNYDFASARNFCFDKASSDFLMWLDADDVITTERALEIKSIIGSLDADTVMLPYQMNNENKTTFWRERILRRSLNPKFVGRVHEVIEPRGKIVYLNIPIVHDKLKVGDPKRNLRIYEMMIADGQKIEGRNSFYYGSELYYNRQFDKAEKILQRFLSEAGAPCDKGQASLFLSRSVIDKTKRCEYLLGGLNYAFSPDLLCELGDVYILSGELDKAKKCFLTALVADENITFPSDENKKLVPHLRLCYCYFHLGDKARAKYHNDLALKLNPDDRRAVYNSPLFK